MKKEVRKTGLSIALFIAAILIPKHMVFWKTAMYGIAYLIAGYDVILKAWKDIRNKEPFGECLLMTIATLGAFGAGFYHLTHTNEVFPEEFSEGVAVMLFYQIGEMFQSYAVRRSRKSISDLMDIRPDYAVIKRETEAVKVDPFEVQVGEIIIVRPGEKVPLDGVVVFGSASFDTSALTGESLPKRVAAGDEILSGYINKDGLVEVRVEKEFSESTASKILDLVENAAANKAKTERFITKFARVYTPIVVFLALGLFLIPGMLTGEWIKWTMRALNFLIVSCPCALVVSVPLSFFGGIGGASKRGILVKGSNYFELLANAGAVVFDKTGTLTEGKFKVQTIRSFDMEETKLLYLTSLAESHSSHPISVSVKEAYEARKEEELPAMYVSEVLEIAGKGISAMVGEYHVLAGNLGLMKEHKIRIREEDFAGTVVYVAVDGVHRGNIVIADKIKPDSGSAIRQLHGMGIQNTVMLTGDREEIAKKVAKELGIDEVYAQLLPSEKVAKVEEICRTIGGKSLLFVGDGINDAPVLARADVGIAMGGIGSDAAIEAADVVIMQDEPSKIGLAIKIARYTMGIARQNIWGAIGVKIAILILSAFGLANMWMAVFGDVGVTVVAILNSFRALYTEKL